MFYERIEKVNKKKELVNKRRKLAQKLFKNGFGLPNIEIIPDKEIKLKNITFNINQKNIDDLLKVTDAKKWECIIDIDAVHINLEV